MAHGLELIISMTDRITGPLKQVTKSLDRLGERGKHAMTQIGIGVVGIVGAGYALKSAVEPALEFNRAMSEIKAVGIGDSGLKKIEQFALDFSSSYGLASVEVVNSTNEIARAIDGLTDNELISFSKSANLLAKSTGSNVQEMGSYLSQMYGIFQRQADKMGRSKWVEAVAGQAAVTANMYKSSGKSLMMAYTNLGSMGEAAGISVAEQLAVIGTLQGAFADGQAGTKYAAFLRGVTKAQQKLGLEFLDSQNRMKPITEILQVIKNRYGDLTDELDKAELAKAFGTEEAIQVINFLMAKTDKLKGDISKIDEVKGLSDAMAVAKITTDSWARLGQIITNLKTTIGTTILNALEPISSKIADIGQRLVNYFNRYKNIAKLIGGVFAVLIGGGGLVAVATALTGIIGLIGVVGGLFTALALPVLIVCAKIALIGVAVYGLWKIFKPFFIGVVDGFSNAFNAMQPLKQSFLSIWQSLKTIASTLFNIIGLCDTSNSQFNSMATVGELVGEVLGGMLNFIAELIGGVATSLERATAFLVDMFDTITIGWNDTANAFKNKSVLDGLIEMAKTIRNVFLKIFEHITNGVIEVVNFIIRQLNKLPALNSL